MTYGENGLGEKFKKLDLTISAAKNFSGKSLSWSFGKKGGCSGRICMTRSRTVSVPSPRIAETGSTATAVGKAARQYSSRLERVPTRARVEGDSGESLKQRQKINKHLLRRAKYLKQTIEKRNFY